MPSAPERQTTFWLLPDRAQSGEIIADDGDTRVGLAARIDPASLPPELVLGIPADVLEAHPEEELVFAQYVRDRRSGRAYYALSVRAGKDRSGRTVCLTSVDVLSLRRGPEPAPSVPASWADDHDHDHDERLAARELRARLATPRPGDGWAVRVLDMLDAALRHPEIDSFATAASKKSVFPHAWTPEKKKARQRARAAFLVATLVLLPGLLTAATLGELHC